jgi:tetratricopeptide (TPR) repeat protein
MRTHSIYLCFVFCAFLSLSGYGVLESRTVLKAEKSEISNSLPEQTPMYLPKADMVRTVTLGFDQLASDILWFHTLNYFGQQLEQRRDIPWMAHMCDLVTELDRKAQHAFEFCSTLISWVAKDPESSIKLLNRAIDENPHYWRYFYIRGFTYWYFLENRKLAVQDLSQAASLPDAPIFLSSLASRLMATDDSPETAISFLQRLLEMNTDEHAREALKEKLKLAYISRDLRALEKQITRFRDQHKRTPKDLEELVQVGILKYVPKDTFGEKYFINEQELPESHKGKRGLEFYGKTAKTGLARW